VATTLSNAQAIATAQASATHAAAMASRSLTRSVCAVGSKVMHATPEDFAVAADHC